MGLLDDARKRAIARGPVQGADDRVERAQKETAERQQQQINQAVDRLPALLEEAIYSGKNFIEVVTIAQISSDWEPDWWQDYCHFHEARKYIDDDPVAKAVCRVLNDDEPGRYTFSLHLKPLPDDPDGPENPKAVVVHAAWR